MSVRTIKRNNSELSGIEQTPAFKTADGQLFLSEEEAIAHQKSITLPKVGNLEMDDRGHICQWAKQAAGGKWRYSIAYFVKDEEGYDLRFVGDRPLKDSVDWDDFREILVQGQRIMDKRFEEEQ